MCLIYKCTVKGNSLADKRTQKRMNDTDKVKKKKEIRKQVMRLLIILL